MRVPLILVFCLWGCNSVLLPKRIPRLNLYETQRARWQLELQSVALSDVPAPAPSPTLGPVNPSTKCDCPEVCGKDKAFPCPCTDFGACPNPNCRNHKALSKITIDLTQAMPEVERKAQEIAAPPAVAAADMFTLWRENLPPTCIVVTTQPGCGPCRAGAREIVAPLVASGWHVVYVDIDYSPELAESLEVKSTPTYIGFKEGVEVGRCTNPDGPLRDAWGTIRGWFGEASTSKIYNADAVIAEWYRGVTWRPTFGTVPDWLARHGVPTEVIARLDSDKQLKLNSALWEMERAPVSQRPTAAPSPPIE